MIWWSHHQDVDNDSFISIFTTSDKVTILMVINLQYQLRILAKYISNYFIHENVSNLSTTTNFYSKHAIIYDGYNWKSYIRSNFIHEKFCKSFNHDDFLFKARVYFESCLYSHIPLTSIVFAAVNFSCCRISRRSFRFLGKKLFDRSCQFPVDISLATRIL